jgi:hypothetical protein
MACFGSPKYDRKEPLHILSADSRFPDVEPKRIRRVGNHFLALFPVDVTKRSNGGVLGGVGGLNHQLRKHALIRGGSRIINNQPPPPPTTRSVYMNDEEKIRNKGGDNSDKWDGGQGRWTRNNADDELEKR